MLFRCPRCQGALSATSALWSCLSCEADYPLRFGFVDFRLGHSTDVDIAADLTLAATLAAQETAVGFSELRGLYYSLRPEASAALHNQHEAHFHAESVRAAHVVEQLGPGPLLDLGCGAGQYLLAAARCGQAITGVDASLCQLLLARRLLADEGLTAELALADVEKLPFADSVFQGAIAADVLEHVCNPDQLLAQAARVLAPASSLRLTTPNRFSLSPEPHVGLWGVGWLPRGLADAYVRKRTGIDYRSIRLLSFRELRRVLKQSFPAGVEIRLPVFSAQELASFSPLKRFFAVVYSILSRVWLLQAVLLRVAPYFEATCRSPIKN